MKIILAGDTDVILTGQEIHTPKLAFTKITQTMKTAFECEANYHFEKERVIITLDVADRRTAAIEELFARFSFFEVLK